MARKTKLQIAMETEVESLKSELSNAEEGLLRSESRVSELKARISNYERMLNIADEPKEVKKSE